jgi:hypothetical protein
LAINSKSFPLSSAERKGKILRRVGKTIPVYIPSRMTPVDQFFFANAAGPHWPKLRGEQAYFRGTYGIGNIFR